MPKTKASRNKRSFCEGDDGIPKRRKAAQDVDHKKDDVGGVGKSETFSAASTSSASASETDTSQSALATNSSNAARQEDVQRCLLETLNREHEHWGSWVDSIDIVMAYLAPVIALVGRSGVYKTPIINFLLQGCCSIVTEEQFRFQAQEVHRKPERSPFYGLVGAHHLTTADMQSWCVCTHVNHFFRDHDFLLPTGRNTCRPDGGSPWASPWGTNIPTYIRHARMFALRIIFPTSAVAARSTVPTSSPLRQKYGAPAQELVWQAGQNREDTLSTTMNLMRRVLRHEQAYQWCDAALALVVYGPFELLRKGAVLVDSAGICNTLRGPEEVLGLSQFLVERENKYSSSDMRPMRPSKWWSELATKLPVVTQVWLITREGFLCDHTTDLVRSWWCLPNAQTLTSLRPIFQSELVNKEEAHQRAFQLAWTNWTKQANWVDWVSSKRKLRKDRIPESRIVRQVPISPGLSYVFQTPWTNSENLDFLRWAFGAISVAHFLSQHQQTA
jgi:hypothetical protein